MHTAILIPARFNASRFPGKMLTDLGGKTLIERVYERCLGTGFDVFVLTDSDEIAGKFDPKMVILQKEETLIRNGTERCRHAVISEFDRLWKYTKFINVQGDMPDITPEIIIAVRRLLRDFEVSTAYTDLPDVLRKDVNTVKAIIHENELEWCARGITDGYQHLGIYGYRKRALQEYPTYPVNPEVKLGLEQLRWLENGFRIGATKVKFDGLEINTPEDAVKWNRRFAQKH